MAERLKDRLSPGAIRAFAGCVGEAWGAFPAEEFARAVLDERWEGLGLKARWRQVTLRLGEYLPGDFGAAIAILDCAVCRVAANCDGLIYFVFPDFVEVFGQAEEDWDVSVSALARYTRYSSSEFAVRAFILRDEARMMEQMYAWSRDGDEHVRRLASEGCRPQLPWGRALESFKRDPAPVLPVLEQLKNDPSAYVRRSVANNLNDISKTHPDVALRLARAWYGKNAHTDGVVKHGCRTLLKKGDPDALSIFGYGARGAVFVRDFALGSESVAPGGELVFSFSLEAREAAKVRLEYGIDYVRAGGKRNRKIFQIAETRLKGGETKPYVRRQSFAELSVRKHYAGIHSVALIVNGEERGSLDFELRGE